MIGWYVHHQGAGHLQRLRAVHAHLRAPVTVLSSLARPEGWEGEWVVLPRDDDPAAGPGDVTAGGVLHWAPVGHPGLLDRSAALLAWLALARPRLVVVDVSVEVALLVRAAGVPVVVAAMTGDRTDRPHRAAYDLADALLAPWPAPQGGPGWPPEWLAKTVHTGAFSRFDDRDAGPPGVAREVLVLWGCGGSDVTEADHAAARAATPGWSWRYRTGTEDPWPDLQRARVVVAHAGHNVVAEVAAARRPAVVVAQTRPHGEQLDRARRVAASGCAVGLDRWPEAAEWPALLARAEALGGQAWSVWNPGDGARRAAEAVDRLASA